MKTRYDYNWGVHTTCQRYDEVLLHIEEGRGFYLTLSDLREMTRALEAPAVETNGCMTCGAPGHDAEHHDECVTPRPQFKENLPAYMESKGWVFRQTCPESGEWFKFTSRGRVMARQGSKLWKLDLADYAGGAHEVSHCDRGC